MYFNQKASGDGKAISLKLCVPDVVIGISIPISRMAKNIGGKIQLVVDVW